MKGALTCSSLPRCPWCLAILLCSMLPLAHVGLGADTTTDRPSVTSPRLDGKIQLDGRFDEPEWKKAATCPAFRGADGPMPAAHQTQVRVFQAKDGLWFAIHCLQPNTPVVRVTDRNGPIYKDDSIEVFLAPNSTTKRYVRLVLNAANVQMDEWKDMPKGATPWRSASVPALDGWRCEIHVPFASLGLQDAPSGALGLSLRRNDQAKHQSSGWTGITPNAAPSEQDFGRLVLSNAAAESAR